MITGLRTKPRLEALKWAIERKSQYQSNKRSQPKRRTVSILATQYWLLSTKEERVGKEKTEAIEKAKPS